MIFFPFRFFNIPMSVLPEIRSSSEIYGYVTEGPLLGIPISGVSGLVFIGAHLSVLVSGDLPFCLFVWKRQIF